MRPQFYLAGKVGGWKWSLVNPFLGSCDFVSSDGEHQNAGDHGWANTATIGPHRWDQCNQSYKYIVETTALEPIRKSQALIACLERSDSFGSIAEIAFASAIGKESHLLVWEKPTEEEKMWGHLPLFDSYWFVASFPGVVVHCVGCNEDATECLDRILRGYGVGCEVESQVYFIEAVAKDEIKIGLADDPRKRLGQLQTANAAQLRLLATIPGGRHEEKELQEKFKHLRITPNREWFRATVELRSYISRIGN